MKIKFIGSGSGLASFDRYHTSLFITSNDHRLLVDCGDGVTKAILKHNIVYNSIDSIIISHLHADHFSGLPSLLTQMKLTNRKNPLNLFIHFSEKDFIEDFIFHSYIFKERSTFNLNIIPFNEEIKIKLFDNFNFTTKKNSHLSKYKIYDLKNKLSFTSLSFIFEDDENKVIYTSDIGSEEDLYLFNNEVDYFITEITHIIPVSLISLAQKCRSDKIVITHLDAHSEESLDYFLKDQENSLKKERFIVAFDGLELNHLEE